MKRIEIKLSDEKYEKFAEYKKKNSSNFNAIINAKIDEILGANEVEFLGDKAENKKVHTIKIKLTKTEFDLLKDCAKSHGFNSVCKEARFRLLNTIYKNAFFTNSEMKELSIVVSEMEKSSNAFIASVKIFKEKKPSEFNLNFKNIELVFKGFLDRANEIKELINKEYQKVYYRILH